MSEAATVMTTSGTHRRSVMRQSCRRTLCTVLRVSRWRPLFIRAQRHRCCGDLRSWVDRLVRLLLHRKYANKCGCSTSPASDQYRVTSSSIPRQDQPTSTFPRSQTLCTARRPRSSLIEHEFGRNPTTRARSDQRDVPWPRAGVSTPTTALPRPTAQRRPARGGWLCGKTTPK